MTWLSLYSRINVEIDIRKKELVYDVWVLNKVAIGNDQRMVRGTECNRKNTIKKDENTYCIIMKK